MSILMIVGLALSVYGALNYQNILSRAGSSGDYSSFNVTNAQGTPIPCNNGNCPTDSLDVNLQINNKDLLSQ